MGELYKNPLRVYLVLGLLAVWGVLAGISLPISLFPNSSKPTIQATVNYGDLTADEFFKSYGSSIESQIKGILVDGKTVEELTAEYRKDSVRYKMEFEWGVGGEKALREAQTLFAALSAAWPEDSRKGYSVFSWNENSGFLALSFYSPTRTLDELFDVLDPLIKPITANVPDSANMGLFNPTQKNIEITLNPEKLAALKVMPSDVENSVRGASSSLAGGRITVGQSKLSIQFPRFAKDLEGIRNLPVYSRGGGTNVQVRDVADVQLKVDTNSLRSFKTSGVSSIILWADPKPGGNIKKMADDVMKGIAAIQSQIPKDIEYRILVNPSEFINSSVHSVVKEVALAALLAVVILLVFIGSFKNVVTAAIEIPLSIVMAFIFMKLFGMNLNLISLGGLALSAGMNVDASVVVMENIFRHFDKAPAGLRSEDRLRIVLEAVKEVWLPVVASTIASLVVFIPLIMTSGLTNSILGDLAKAVVFSHSMSAIVALVLVPTVRLQMMQTETTFHLKSPIEKQFEWLENLYANSLEGLIRSRKAKLILYTSIVGVLIALGILVLPRLPVEVIGRPETDWMMLGYNSSTFTEARHIESFTEKLEYELNEKYGDEMAYTFTQLNGVRNGYIMIRLKDRSHMDAIWKKLEEQYVNTPDINYWVEPWNPSELPIPDPPHLRLEVRGGTPEARQKLSQELYVLIQEANVFPRVRTTPDSTKNEEIVMTVNLDVLANSERNLRVTDVASFVRLATAGKSGGELSIDNKTYNVWLNMPPERVKSIEDLKGLPVSLGNKIVPLSALANVRLQDEAPELYRLDQNEMSIVTARENESSKADAPKKQKEAKAVIEKWQAARKDKSLSVLWTQPDEEVQQALGELKWALLLSILLIFVVMVVQFGDVMHSLLVLVAVPLGFIGVLLSLFIFKSTLSLNSALGMILLNGIAVANSIILVDFMKRLVDGGMAPEVAAVQAARARLRPILMTSLTTVLGMTPIALGFGEGGRILQPLGIAVAGGLWISMLLTIFVVPTLQTVYMRRKLNRAVGAALARTQWQNEQREQRELR